MFPSKWCCRLFHHHPLVEGPFLYIFWHWIFWLKEDSICGTGKQYHQRAIVQMFPMVVFDHIAMLGKIQILQDPFNAWKSWRSCLLQHQQQQWRWHWYLKSKDPTIYIIKYIILNFEFLLWQPINQKVSCNAMVECMREYKEWEEEEILELWEG